jgi:hypothetical protein
MLVLRVGVPVHDPIRFLLFHEIDKELERGMKHDVILIRPPLLQRVNPQDLHSLISCPTQSSPGAGFIGDPVQRLDTIQGLPPTW